MWWVRLIYCDYEFAFASISHNMIQVGQYERVRGVLDIANVRHVRSRSFLDIGRSEQGLLFIMRDVLPPVARLNSAVLPGLRSNQVKSQYSCRNSYNCDNFASDFEDRCLLKYQLRPVSHVPSRRYRTTTCVFTCKLQVHPGSANAQSSKLSTMLSFHQIVT